MNDLETLLIFLLVVLPALFFWICTISYVANKLYDEYERKQQYEDELTGYDKIVDQIKRGVCEESLTDAIMTLGEEKEEYDSYLKRVSDYRDTKYKYVEDKLNDYLNTDEGVKAFKGIFGTQFETYEWKRDTWKLHLEVKREEFGSDFDNL